MKKSIDRFVRDPYNQGAVLNTDNEALKAYKLMKNKDKKISSLENDIKDLKSMLQQILEKIK